ncbi:MAG: serine/threonine-protein kinase [Solirubrobacterales bacterium]
MRRLAAERYELEHRLGHGGMATVWCAQDQKLDRKVAIKLLADNFAGDKDARKRFMREARLAAKLDHPNVIQVFDVGEEDGRPYIVMEHVDGGTVADRLERRRRSMPQPEAIRLLCQLCDGLGHAHAKKLVHRDIKPQNLLVRKSDGCLKITDFGIARAAEETTRLTRPGKVIGTDRYMAPEQLADGKITAATDVYACGVVADEMLSQTRGPELREIVDRCLREDPGDRFSDAHALGEALATVNGEAGGVMQRIRTQGRPTARGTRSTAQLPATEATAALSRRRRGGGRLVAVLAVAAIVVVGVIAALNSGGTDSPSSPTKATSANVVPPSTSVPQSDDPAQQARQLADFLRAQARQPAP